MLREFKYWITSVAAIVDANAIDLAEILLCFLRYAMLDPSS